MGEASLVLKELPVQKQSGLIISGKVIQAVFPRRNLDGSGTYNQGTIQIPSNFEIPSGATFEDLSSLENGFKNDVQSSIEERGMRKMVGISQEVFDQHEKRIDEKIAFNNKYYEEKAKSSEQHFNERLEAMSTFMEKSLSEFKAVADASIARHETIATEIRRETGAMNVKLESMGQIVTAKLDNIEKQWTRNAIMIGLVGITLAIVIGGLQIMSAIKSIPR